MEKAYIVLAHKNAAQVLRLITSLQDGSSDFFLHIDKKVEVSDFDALRKIENIFWVDRVVTDWAGYGLVQATLNAMHSVKGKSKSYDRIILLSGQDYSIKTNEYINNFLQSAQHRVFIEYFPLPNYTKWTESGGLYRVNKYFFGFEKHQVLLRKSLNFLSTYIPAIRRKLDRPQNPYAGSQWWIMDMEALNYVLNYLNANPQYARFHKYTFAPDEVFFQTLLLNAPAAIVNTIFCGDIRFMNWQQPDSPHPDLLMKSDFNKLVASPALFARKFDDQQDEEILNYIDEYILNTATSPMRVVSNPKVHEKVS